MNKELTPLEALNGLFNNPYYIALGRVQGKKRFHKDMKIIEKALKELAEIDDVLNDHNLSKKDIINAIALYRYYKDNAYDINKKLKEYEILKKCLYVGKSGAIAITGYGFDNHDLLEEILK